MKTRTSRRRAKVKLDDIPLADPAIFEACRRAIAPPTRMTVSEWADRHRVLSPVMAAAPGPWRTSKVPYAREIMDRLSTSDPAGMVVLAKASQVAGTEIGNNWLGYIIHHAPGPTAFVMPTEEDARLANEQRIEPLIESTPELRELVTEARAKEKGSRRFLKQFPGGLIRSVWANSPAKLKSMPAGKIFMDECDEYPADAGGQGDPVELALARMRTFKGTAKVYIPSTPTNESSRIWSLYLRGDQRRYYVPCPACGERQTLEWEGLKFERDDHGLLVEGSTYYECKACAHRMKNADKVDLLAKGEWRPTARGEKGITSYHISTLYAPVDWFSWDDIASTFCKAYKDLKEKRDSSAMITFYNTILGLPWLEDFGNDAALWSAIAARAEPYAAGLVPSSVLMLTAGVDVQDDRLEVSVYGWGVEEEAWLITHEVFAGDPSKNEVWEELDEFLLTEWPSVDDRHLKILATAVDSGDGDHMQDAYAFARPRRRRGVFAIKGSSSQNAPMLGKPTLQDLDHQGKRVEKGVRLWPLGVHRIKKVLARRLRIADPGPRYIHTYEGIDDTWYQQLCGEYLAKRQKGTTTVETWTKVKPSQAVEAWDCLVYAYAAALRLGIDRGVLERLAAEREATGRRPAPRPVVSASVSAPVSRQAPVEPPRQAEGPAVRTVSSSPPPRQTVVRSRWVSRR